MTVTNEGTTLSTFTYDNNGNMAVKNVGGSLTTYTYSIENKMVGITYPDESLNTFTYDAEGKRLRKQDSGGTLRYVYDPQGPTGLYDLAAETNNEGTVQAFYTQGPMLLAMRRGGASYFYHDDAIGSTSAITNSSETTTSTYKYYAFGEVLTSTGTLTNPFKYVGGLGYYTDPDSSLVLLRARYYWPVVGRFVSWDPAREAMNWYLYAASRAVLVTDPEGLRWLENEFVHFSVRNTPCRVGGYGVGDWNEVHQARTRWYTWGINNWHWHATRGGAVVEVPTSYKGFRPCGAVDEGQRQALLFWAQDQVQHMRLPTAMPVLWLGTAREHPSATGEFYSGWGRWAFGIIMYLRPAALVSPDEWSMFLAHEMGHAFGAQHTPGNGLGLMSLAMSYPEDMNKLYCKTMWDLMAAQRHPLTVPRCQQCYREGFPVWPYWARCGKVVY